MRKLATTTAAWRMTAFTALVLGACRAFMVCSPRWRAVLLTPEEAGS